MLRVFQIRLKVDVGGSSWCLDASTAKNAVNAHEAIKLWPCHKMGGNQVVNPSPADALVDSLLSHSNDCANLLKSKLRCPIMIMNISDSSAAAAARPAFLWLVVVDCRYRDFSPSSFKYFASVNVR